MQSPSDYKEQYNQKINTNNEPVSEVLNLDESLSASQKQTGDSITIETLADTRMGANRFYLGTQILTDAISSTQFSRHEVDPDGDCGYTAFGIERMIAYEALSNSLPTQGDMLRDVVAEQPLQPSFVDYLIQEGIGGTGLQTTYQHYQTTTGEANTQAMNDLQRYADDLAVRQGYLDYDVRDGKIDAGWAHPVVLQMLAHLQGIELYIWRLGDNGQLLPHDLYHHYQPSNATQRTDLLFVNNNYFERLEKLDYTQPSKLKNEDIFESLEKQENTPKLDNNLSLPVLITAHYIKQMLQPATRPPLPTTPYQQTFELLIQFGERLKQCFRFEELKASVIVKRPLEFVLDKKLSYLSGYVLQAASLLVTSNDKNLVPWLAAIGTLIGSTGYSIFKTLEITRSNYQDIQETQRLAQLLYNNLEHRNNLRRIFLPFVVHASVNALLTGVYFWGVAWSLQDDPEKTSANRLIFTYLIGFCLMHMLANSLVASDRQDTKARLKYTQFEAAFTLGNLYHPSLLNYLPNEQAAIRKLLFNYSELALQLSLKHKLTLEQTLWLLAMVDKVFAKKDLTQLKSYQLAVLLDPNGAAYNWLTVRKLNTAVFMRLPEQHLLILHEYSQRIEDELALILLGKTLERLFDYLAAQSAKLTYESLSDICFAIAHDFKTHEVLLCQVFNQTLHQWRSQQLEPQKIQHYLNIIKAFDFTPEKMAAIDYDASLLDILSANVELAKLLTIGQLTKMSSGTNYRRLLDEGKLTLTDPIIANSERLTILNRLDSGLLTRFNEQGEYIPLTLRF